MKRSNSFILKKETIKETLGTLIITTEQAKELGPTKGIELINKFLKKIEAGLQVLDDGTVIALNVNSFDLVLLDEEIENGVIYTVQRITTDWQICQE